MVQLPLKVAKQTHAPTEQSAFQPPFLGAFHIPAWKTLEQYWQTLPRYIKVGIICVICSGAPELYADLFFAAVDAATDVINGSGKQLLTAAQRRRYREPPEQLFNDKLFKLLF